MRRAFTFFSSEVRGLHAAAYILAASSLFSSCLALLRDRLFAHIFGAGSALDLYYAAFRIPDMVFIGVGALVSAYMLIPELARRDEAEQRRYLDTVLAGFSVMVAVLSAIAAVFAPDILERVFPAMCEGGKLPQLVFMTRILLLQAIFLGFSNIAAAITQFKHRYALYACAPIVYNLGIIAGVLLLYPFWGFAGLAWGVVAGAFAHLMIQVPAIIADGYFRSLPRFSDARAFFHTVFLSLPRALALTINQLAVFGLLTLAATLGAGSISVLVFAFNLNNVPLVVIGASYATAAFPALSHAFSRGESDTFLAQVACAARQILFWSLPIIAIILVLRAHIVRAILGSGAFDWTDTRLTAAALALLVFSLAAQSMSLLLIRAFYACGKTLVPLTVAASSAIITLALGFFLIRSVDPDVLRVVGMVLRVEDVAGRSVLALPIAYSFASITGMFALAIHFEVRFRGFFEQLHLAWWESLTAALAGGSAAYLTLNVIGDINLSSALVSVLLKATVAGSTGIIAVSCTYFLLGNRTFVENLEALRRRWRGAEPIA